MARDQKITVADERTLRWMIDQCHRVNGFRYSGPGRFSKTRRTMSLSLPTPDVGRATSSEFQAIITGSASLASASVAVNGGSAVTVIYRWKYAWSEAELNGDLWQVKSGGRSGTTTSNYALNDLEDFHTGAINWNATITGAAYPRGHRPKPVGGASADTNQTHSYNVPVRMRPIVDVNGNTKYRFVAPGGHFGVCT